MNKDRFKWNPAYNYILKIKNEYINKFLFDDIYFFESPYKNIIEYWISKLKNDEYNEFLNLVNINQENELILIKYDMIECARRNSDLWVNNNSLLRECRSLVINIDTEEIVLAPFKKFFNVDEIESNTLENLTKEIMNAECVEWSNKLDCSLQNATWYQDKPILTGSQSLSEETSWRVADGYQKLTEKYVEMLKDHEDLTFSFENINNADKHVVKYTDEQQGLYLIGVRDNTTGYQYSYSEVKSIADAYDIRMTEIEDITLKEALKLAKKFKASEKEGWVLYIDGRLVKIKCEDYIQMHKLVGRYTSPNYIVEAVYNDKLDEFLIQAPEIYKEEILRIASLVKDYTEKMNKDINYWHDIAPKTDRKSFMIFIDENVEQHLKGYVRSKYLNKDYNVLQKGSGCKTAKEIGIDNECLSE